MLWIWSIIVLLTSMEDIRELSNLSNIGKVVEEQLIQVDIIIAGIVKDSKDWLKGLLFKENLSHSQRM